MSEEQSRSSSLEQENDHITQVNVRAWSAHYHRNSRTFYHQRVCCLGRGLVGRYGGFGGSGDLHHLGYRGWN
jgi:hypothetical protein